MSANEKTWKTKLKRVAVVAVVALLFIWAFSTANDAKTIAKSNSEELNTPTYDMSLLLGGPERFANNFDNLDNAEPDNIQVGNYVWATLRIKNTGYGDASDAEVRINRTIPTEQVLVSSTGFANEVKIESGEEPNTTVINMEHITSQEPLYIYLGVKKDNLPDDWKSWQKSFENVITSAKIDGEDASATLFGDGYSKTI